MTWNYRVIKFKYWEDEVYEIYEVYYNKKQKPIGYAEKPVEISFESIKSLKKQLKRFRKALSLPILTEEDFKQCTS